MMELWKNYSKIRRTDYCTLIIFKLTYNEISNLKFQKVLIIGADFGQFAYYLSKNNSIDVYDIFDKRDINFYGNYKFYDFSEIYNLPHTSEYDYILCYNFLERINESVEKLLHHLYSILKMGGQLLIIASNGNRLMNKIIRKKYPYSISKQNYDLYYHEYTKLELIEMLKLSGFFPNKYIPVYLGIRTPFTHRFALKYPYLLQKYCQYHFIKVTK